MRIVQVNYAFEPGIATPDALLDRYFTLTGWSDAIRAAGGEVLTVQQFHSTADLRREGNRYVFGPLSRVVRTAASFAPDVAHVNGLAFPVRTWLLRRALPSAAALVVQDHGGGIPRTRGHVLDAVRRSFMTAADAFLFSAVAQAEPWRRAGLIRPDRQVFEVMEASTQLRPIAREQARSSSGLAGSPAVLWVGRLNDNKDPLTVISAFERFAASRPGALLTMVFHEHELLAAVRTRIAESAVLRDRVRLVGEVPHDRMASFLSAADLFVSGSHHEGSGYALIEAIACGATPVVTDIPAFRMLTNGGSIGVLWTPGDVDGCARALAEASASDRDVDRWRVLDWFARGLAWDAVGRRAMEIYRSAASRARLPRADQRT